MPIGLGLPSPATVLFNRQVRGLLPNIKRSPMVYDCNKDHYNSLKSRQGKLIISNDTLKERKIKPAESTLAVQREDGGPWTRGTFYRARKWSHSDWSCMICITKAG